jgi:ribonuclease-3
MGAARLDAARLGYVFQRPGLLRLALTHRSYGAEHNERLEFLGDGVLNCVIAEALYGRFPALSEGELSQLRATMVNQQRLYQIAAAAGIGDAVRLGEGELRSGGATRPSILADALEALIGAVLLDGGYDAARSVVLRLFGTELEALDPRAVSKDAKTRLQEWLQGRGQALPRYRVLGVHGEAHAQCFEVECVIDAHTLSASGRGRSRRAAEQQAAAAALAVLAGAGE